MARRRKRKIKFKNLPTSVKIRKIITYVLFLVGIGCLGYFVFYLNEASSTQKNLDHLSSLKDTNYRRSDKKYTFMHMDKEKEAPDILEDYITLYNNNKSLVGWISIEGTLVDYPVMQSHNEEYYLDHNFNQEKDNNGSIFIDKDCSIWPRSQNIIIYGHNMKSGKMFGQLKDYKSKSFYEKHKTILFDSLYEKGTYEVMYVFGDNIYDESEVTFKYYQFIDPNSEAEWNSAMTYMAEKSLYETEVTAPYGSELITLSTCDYEKNAERFVIVAKRVD